MAYAQDVDTVLTATKEGGSLVALTCHVNSINKRVSGEQRDITARCDTAKKTRVVRTTTTLEVELKVPIGAALFVDGDVGDEYSLSFKTDSTATADAYTNAVLTELGVSSSNGSEITQSVTWAINGA